MNGTYIYQDYIYVPTPKFNMNCINPKWITIKYKESIRANLSEWEKFNDGKLLMIPCGKCLACKTNYAIEWAKRCVVQTTDSKNNYFLTLTYDDNKLPLTQKQNADNFTKLIKQLRKYKQFCKLKYLFVGEYGEQTARIHGHALIWNFALTDLIYYKMSGTNPIFISPKLNQIWGNGNIIIGELNEATAFYCLKYSYKHINGQDCIKRQSQGIGKNWFYKNINWAHHFTNNKYFNKLKNKILDEKTKIWNRKNKMRIWLEKNGKKQLIDIKQLKIDLEKAKALNESKSNQQKIRDINN